MKIPGWNSFQHYHQRRPPWIKLHRQLLDNPKWHALSGDASKLLVECWLLASESEPAGEITLSMTDLAWRLRRNVAGIEESLQELVAQGLIENASMVLAECLHDAPTSGAQRRGETEERQRQRNRTSKTRTEYPAEFEAVWSVHRRGPKLKALAEWKKAVPARVGNDELTTALRAYVAREINDRFHGHDLHRWIRDGRWEEYQGVNLNGRHDRTAVALDGRTMLR